MTTEIFVIKSQEGVITMTGTCKGCVSNDWCGLPHDSSEKLINQCPCGTCIVKSMCNTELCNDYRKFVEKVREEWKT